MRKANTKTTVEGAGGNGPNRFPHGALSVISEGSYRTSQDGDSLPTTSLPRSLNGTFDEEDSAASNHYRRTVGVGAAGGVGVGGPILVSFEDADDLLSRADGGGGGDDDSSQGGGGGVFGLFLNEYRSQRNTGCSVGGRESKNKKNRRTKLTAASIMATSNNVRSIDLDVKNDVSSAISTPDLKGGTEPCPISQPVVQNSKSHTSRTNHNNGKLLLKKGVTPPPPPLFQVIPMWLKFVVVFCFIMVIGSMTIGVVAWMSHGDKKTSNESRETVLQSRTRPISSQATATESPTPSPT